MTCASPVLLIQLLEGVVGVSWARGGFGRVGVEIPVSSTYYEVLLPQLEKLGVVFKENHREL